MVTAQVLSAVLMAGVLIVVLIAASRIARKADAPVKTGDERWNRLFERLQTAADDPGVWAAGFLLLAVGLGVGAVAVVGDGLVEGVPADLLAVVLGATFALVMVAYLFWGTYAASRHRGLGNAQAVGVGIGALGLVFLAVVTFQLMFGLVG